MNFMKEYSTWGGAVLGHQQNQAGSKVQSLLFYYLIIGNDRIFLVSCASHWERQILYYATHLTTPPVLSPGGTNSSQLTWQAKVETRMHLFIVYVWAKYSVYYQPSSGWLWPLLGELLSWRYVTDRKNKYRTLSFRAECCSKFYFKISPQLQLYPQNSIICNLYSVMSLREN